MTKPQVFENVLERSPMCGDVHQGSWKNCLRSKNYLATTSKITQAFIANFQTNQRSISFEKNLLPFSTETKNLTESE